MSVAINRMVRMTGALAIVYGLTVSFAQPLTGFVAATFGAVLYVGGEIIIRLDAILRKPSCPLE